MHVPCVGAVVHGDDGRLLLVRRRHDPEAGRWTVPGGRVETGETDEQAVQREVLEEAGLHVIVGLLLGTVTRPGPVGVSYDIRDYACSLAVPGTTPVPGDDATDVQWVNRAELLSLEAAGQLTEGLVQALSGWGMLPH